LLSNYFFNAGFDVRHLAPPKDRFRKVRAFYQVCAMELSF